MYVCCAARNQIGQDAPAFWDAVEDLLLLGGGSNGSADGNAGNSQVSVRVDGETMPPMTDRRTCSDTFPCMQWQLCSSVVRLWSPAPVLENHVKAIEKHVFAGSKHVPNPRPDATSATAASAAAVGPAGATSSLMVESGRSPPLAMDLGCGAGRDSCFLALRGWRVVAVDNMKKALERVRLLESRCA